MRLKNESDWSLEDWRTNALMLRRAGKLDAVRIAELEQQLAAAQQAQRDAEQQIEMHEDMSGWLDAAEQRYAEQRVRAEAAEAAADEAITNLARVSQAEYERGKAEVEERLNRVIEASSIAETARLNAEAECDLLKSDVWAGKSIPAKKPDCDHAFLAAGGKPIMGRGWQYCYHCGEPMVATWQSHASYVANGQKFDAETDLQRAREALRRYGHHDSICVQSDRCRCGFYSALEIGQ